MSATSLATGTMQHAVGAKAFETRLQSPISEDARQEWTTLIEAQLDMAGSSAGAIAESACTSAGGSNTAHYFMRSATDHCYDIRELGHQYELAGKQFSGALQGILPTDVLQREFLLRWAIDNPHVGIERMPGMKPPVATMHRLLPYPSERLEQWLVDPAGHILRLLYGSSISASGAYAGEDAAARLVAHGVGAVWLPPTLLKRWINEPLQYPAQWLRADSTVPSLSEAHHTVAQWTLGFGAVEEQQNVGTVDFYETPNAARALYSLRGVTRTTPLQPFVAVRITSASPSNPRTIYASAYVHESINSRLGADEVAIAFPFYRSLQQSTVQRPPSTVDLTSSTETAVLPPASSPQPTAPESWKIEPVVLPLAVKIVLRTLSSKPVAEHLATREFFQDQLSRFRVLQSGQFIVLDQPGGDTTDILPYEVAELWGLVRCTGGTDILAGDDDRDNSGSGLTYELGLVAAANVTNVDVIVDFVPGDNKAGLAPTGRGAVIDALNRMSRQLITVPDRRRRENEAEQLWRDAILAGALAPRIFAARARHRPPPDQDIETPVFSVNDRILLNLTPISTTEIQEMLLLLLRGADPRLSVNADMLLQLFGASKTPLRKSQPQGLGGLHVVPWRNFGLRPRPSPGTDDIIFRYEVATCRWLAKNIRGTDAMALSPRSTTELLALLSNPDYVYFIVDANNTLRNPVVVAAAPAVVSEAAPSAVVAPTVAQQQQPAAATTLGGGATTVPGTTDERILQTTTFLNIPEAQVRQILLRNRDLLQTLPTMASLQSLRLRKQDAAVLANVFGVPAYLDRDIIVAVAEQNHIPFDVVASVAYQYADLITRRRPEQQQALPRLGNATEQFALEQLRAVYDAQHQ